MPSVYKLWRRTWHVLEHRVDMPTCVLVVRSMRIRGGLLSAFRVKGNRLGVKCPVSSGWGICLLVKLYLGGASPWCGLGWMDIWGWICPPHFCHDDVPKIVAHPICVPLSAFWLAATACNWTTVTSNCSTYATGPLSCLSVTLVYCG